MKSNTILKKLIKVYALTFFGLIVLILLSIPACIVTLLLFWLNLGFLSTYCIRVLVGLGIIGILLY